MKDKLSTVKQSLHDWTPTLYSQPLSRLANKSIYLKMECNQPTGSFKIRGIGRLCQHYIIQGATHFISSSGGNAGIATAYAGKLLGVKVDVFVPQTSNPIFLQAITDQGATVHVAGASWQEANEYALALVKELNAAYIPPFDHPILWQGHASLIDEVVADGIAVDAIVVAVGGGGLACGILEGMHHHHWQQIPLYTVETIGAASFYASVAKNKLVSLAKIDTIATSLGAKQVAKQLFAWRAKHEIIPLKVTDKACVAAITQFVDQHRILLEPACAAALSVLYDKHPALIEHQRILVIVCGGVGVSLELLRHWQLSHKL